MTMIDPSRIRGLLSNRGPLSTDALYEIIGGNRLELVESIHWLESRTQIKRIDSVEHDKEGQKVPVKAWRLL
jgi:hypothetical protein